MTFTSHFGTRLTHNRAILVMLLVTFLWSTAGVVTRHLEVAKSFEVTFWRSFFTVACLAILLPMLNGRSVFTQLRHAGRAFWISSLCWCGMFTFYMMALMMTSVANVLVTMAIGPLLTALIARVFIGQKIPLRTWVAIFVAGIGIAWMFAAQLQGGQLLGTLVALGVPLAGAINWTITQNAHDQGHDVDLTTAVMMGAVFSCLITLPMALPFSATQLDIALLASLGAFQLAVPCVLSVVCARVLKAPEVSLLALLEVPFGIILVWIGANEAPSSTVLLGGALVIGALVTNELVGWRQRG